MIGFPFTQTSRGFPVPIAALLLVGVLSGCLGAECRPDHVLRVTVENDEGTQTAFTVMAVRNGTVLINESFMAGPQEGYTMLMGVGFAPYEFVLIADGVKSTYIVHPGCPVTGMHVRWSGGREPTEFIDKH